MTTITENEKQVHLALYRKYRPKDFQNLVGQEHVQAALSNALSQGKPSHAYLFTGPRGTGKTSSALLFAKALNCQSPVNGAACGQCTPCKNPEDIVERDAATHNSVESIRELNSTVGYAPMYGKYKIIILDETHMLSGGAFNALLKTLEEPPAHVIFILASTEVHKIPATITSRCQRFDFKRISNQVIVERLAYIAQNEGITVEENALNLIAQCSVGGMRDAIGLLDQSASITPDKVVTLDTVLGLTGSIDVTITGTLIRDVLSGSIEQALDTFAKAFESKEPKFFIEEMLIYIRDILMFKKIGPHAPLKKAYMDKNFEQTVSLLSNERAYDLLGELQKATGDINYSQDVNLFVELLIIKLINNQREKSLQGQIDELRAALMNGIVPAAATPSIQAEPMQSVPLEQENAIVQGDNLPKSEPMPEISSVDIPEFNISDNTETMPIFSDAMGTSNVNIPLFEQPSEPSVEEVVIVQQSQDDEFIEVEEPIEFIKQAEEIHAAGGDWTTIPLETPEHESDEAINLVEPAKQEPIAPASQEPQALVNSGNLADEPTIGNVGNIVLSDKQIEVLNILSSADATSRQEFEAKQDAIIDGLKISLSTLAIYREFTINAVNEHAIVLTHEEKAKIKLISIAKNRSLIESVIEDHYKTMRLYPLTQTEWIEVIAVYQSQNK